MCGGWYSWFYSSLRFSSKIFPFDLILPPSTEDLKERKKISKGFVVVVVAIFHSPFKMVLLLEENRMGVG